MHTPVSSSPHRPRRSALARALTGVAVASATAVILSGCSTPAAPVATEGEADFGELSIQLSWIKNVEFAGEYFADSEGYYEDAGFSSVQLIAGPGATESTVASGGALVGLTDPISVAPVIVNEGAELKIIGTTYQKNPFTILSLTDGANIVTPQDMIGKRIGVQAGNETLFNALLDVNDIGLDEVTVVPVEYDPSPLITGDVDGFLAYVTNESVIVESQGYEVTNLLYADNGLEFVTESFVVSQDSIDNNREALKAFLYASILGWKDSIADPEGSAALAVDVYGADLGLDLAKELKQAEAATGLIVTDETDANGLFTISDALLAANISVLEATGVTISAEDLFDMSLLAEVYEEHPELLE
jgi:ABC-type nitrate/sulfonate/bicarbonate transport system substrate-binding protein